MTYDQSYMFIFITYMRRKVWIELELFSFISTRKLESQGTNDNMVQSTFSNMMITYFMFL